MNKLIQATTLPARPVSTLTSEQRDLLPIAFGDFVDGAATATARGSFYNTKQEQTAALEKIHQELFALDRGVYTASLLLPGVNDYSRQIGIARLLRQKDSGDGLLSTDGEAAVMAALVESLPPQRMLKLFGMLREARVNNARTRRLILATLLTAKNLEFWAVKYRRKLATALTHAWGRRTTSILRAILAKPATVRSEKEQQIVRQHIDRYVDVANRDRIYECVRFVLGDETDLTLPRLAAYRDAKHNFARGEKLPYEVMEGLRSRFHTAKSSDDVLQLTKRQLTEGQKFGMQRKAKQADVKVEFDPAKYDAVRLYIYAYEMGLTEAIRSELKRKAERVAARLPITFGHAGILVDVSASMAGHDTQRLRPISVALAMRDLLVEMSDQATIFTSNGRLAPQCELAAPAGDTSLAMGLVQLLKQEPDIVFVLTDGYENAPAGRFAEVVRAVRRMGVRTPIHQFSPVFAAEAGGVRSLSEDVTKLPVNKPDAMGLGLLKSLFEADIERGVTALLSMVQPSLLDKSDERRAKEVKYVS